MLFEASKAPQEVLSGPRFSDIKLADTGPLPSSRLGNMPDITSCQFQKGANDGGRSASSEAARGLSFGENI